MICSVLDCFWLWLITLSMFFTVYEILPGGRRCRVGLEAEELYISPEVNSDNPVILFLYNPKFSHSTK